MDEACEPLTARALDTEAAFLIANGHLSLRVDAGIRDVLAEAYEAGRRFFALTRAEKLENRLPDDCGYRPKGVEYSRTSDGTDLIESYTACTRTTGASACQPSKLARALHKRLMSIFDEIEPIAHALAGGLFRSVKQHSPRAVPPGTFRSWSRVQMNSADSGTAEAEFINDEHEDGNFLTIASATGPGLELLGADGEFRAHPRGRNELLVFSGEVARLLSGGHIRPTFHRVRRTKGQSERMSILFFGDIDPSTCLPWIDNELNRDVDIAEIMLRTPTRFGLSGFSRSN
jgi:isopenicillin N synthase-like dioxygenase